jgi:type IV pilus assembly protein PilB
MVAATLEGTLSGLGRAMVQRGLLAERDAEAIQTQAKTARIGFVEQLILGKKFKEAEIAEFAAITFGLPLLDLGAIEADQMPLKTVDDKFLQNRRAVPLFQRGNKLYVGMSDPTNRAVLDELKFQTGLQIEPIVVEDAKLGTLLQKVVKATETSLRDVVGEDIGADLLAEAAPEEEPIADAANEVEDAPIVRYLQKVLLDAIGSGASDIHFEPYEKFYRIRYRMDGILYEIAQPPLLLKDKIASRIKIISRLDIAEKRIPQDGRMKLILSKDRAIDFRVSTLPTLHGEKVVMRILDPSSATLGIEALGYEPDQKEALLWAINRPYGMILVTGPTGSGKTVSLYTCLNMLNEPGINIATAEDPAEINLAGINQVNVNDKAGLTFAAALKSFLRQDPDIIMVGEIRDLETAEIAVKAAQTGHLVLSTLHTNDAPTTLTRLLNMGVAPFNIASSVILISAQRLARRLCKECKQPADIPQEALLRAGFQKTDLDSSWTPYEPVGCDVCKGTGYKGRVGIYQVMKVSEELSRIIMTNGNAIDIAEQSQREGIRDLRQSGLQKVRQGMTSLKEVEACTNE